jgi:hypothetical protein
MLSTLLPFEAEKKVDTKEAAKDNTTHRRVLDSLVLELAA